MAQDVLSADVDGPSRESRSEANWRALMAEFERWNGTQTCFCNARGVALKRFQSWRRIPDHLRQPGPVPPCSGHRFLEDAFVSCFQQALPLQAGTLSDGQDACKSEIHAGWLRLPQKSLQNW